MTTDLLLAASAYDPSKDLRLLIGVPVLVALITGLLTGGAGIVVALLTSRRQANIAAADRKAANDREQAARDAADAREQRAREDARRQADDDRAERERQLRADVHESIVAEISANAGAYSSVIREARKMDDYTAQRVARPPRAALIRALNRLISRLGEDGLFSDAIGLLGAGDRYTTVVQAPIVLGTLQERLDFWFLGKRSTVETRRLLREDAAALKAGVLPTEADPEDLPDR